MRSAPLLAPPTAKVVPAPSSLHGDTRVDNYHWLRDKESEDTLSYLREENAYTDAVMEPRAELAEALYEEILGRIKQTDLSVPVKDGNYYYVTKTVEGKQYPIYARTKGAIDGPSEILLDLNAMADDHSFLGVGAFEVSDSGDLLAYTLDTSGFREYTLHIRDLKTGKDFPESFEKVKSVAWAADNKTLLFTGDDHAKRAYQIKRHVLGDDPKDAKVILEENDERFRVGVWRSRSKAYLFVGAFSHTACDIHYVDATRADSDLLPMAGRRDEHEYYADHRGDQFFIRTNDKGRNFRVVTAPTESPGEVSWKQLIPHSDDVMIAGFSVFKDHWVAREREGGLPHVRIGEYGNDNSHRIAMPEPVYNVSGEQNPEFDTDRFRYRYESLTTPSSVFDYHIEKRDSELLKETEVLGDYDRTQYESQRVYATATDGTRVPVSLVYKKGIAQNGSAPMLLGGYGSYGFAYPARFSHARVSLLDRGVVYAIAHIRGGGEMGTKWHDNGRMFHKKNSFTDFISVAEHLLAEKWTNKDKLVIEGGSAGGLLMGAVSNMRPELFHAVISHVPFVDVLNTMLDDDLPLTVGEYEEWGNPKIKEQYAYIKSYCPYTNVEAKAYPAMLIKTSLNDSQVMYWEPAKYVAKLRAMKTDDHSLLFKINMDGGHGGSSGRYDRIKETAFDYAFLLWQVGAAI
jgi:oligopeptidase B